jgi:hypothetical protein
MATGEYHYEFECPERDSRYFCQTKAGERCCLRGTRSLSAVIAASRICSGVLAPNIAEYLSRPALGNASDWF